MDRAAVEAELTERYGPLAVVDEGTDVGVWRAGRGDIVKWHAHPSRARREIEALEVVAAAACFAHPRLRSTETVGGGVALVLDDVRAGRDARQRRLRVEQVAPAARCLAALHAWPATTGRGSWAEHLSRAVTLPLPARLREGLASLVAVEDAFCHGDLHPSNWLIEEGEPAGWLDWGSARRADPEWDLAGLVLAVGRAEVLEEVAVAWSAAARREADRARIQLYLWLQLEEELARMPRKQRLLALREAVVTYRAPAPALGTVRRPRLVPEASRPGYWIPVADDDAARVRAVLRHPSRLATAATGALERYGGHACNDVLRLEVDGQPRVVKVYNKPVAPWLFPLERHLAAHAPEPVQVLAPLPLPGGGDVFRIGGRPGAVYPDAGTQRIGNRRADVVRVAGAQAALHRLDDLAARFPDLAGSMPGIDWELVLDAVDGKLAPSLLARVEDVWMPYADEIWRHDPALPHRLVHGSLNRDHTALPPAGGPGLVVFDFEKARLGPAIADAVRTASFVGYRGNDETLDPGRFVLFLRSYHRLRPLRAAEQRWIVPLFLRWLVHDLKALAQEGASPDVLGGHARVLLEVARNARNLERALATYLG